MLKDVERTHLNAKVRLDFLSHKHLNAGTASSLNVELLVCLLGPRPGFVRGVPLSFPLGGSL